MASGQVNGVDLGVSTYAGLNDSKTGDIWIYHGDHYVLIELYTRHEGTCVKGDCPPGPVYEVESEYWFDGTHFSCFSTIPANVKVIY